MGTKKKDRNYKGILAWAEEERPRERLEIKGATALSDAELLGIVINTGTPERSALQLAKDVLQLAGNNLFQLGRLQLYELKKVKGVGPAKAVTLAAVLELGRRIRISKGLAKKTIHGYGDALEILFPLLQDLQYEAFCVLYLSAAQNLIRHEILSNGGLTATVVDVRMILKNALLCNAAKIIVAHNHPSGNKKPSPEDKKLTAKLKQAAATMDIVLVDHLIIAGTVYTSFANEGLL